jgi:hypothetical protein
MARVIHGEEYGETKRKDATAKKWCETEGWCLSREEERGYFAGVEGFEKLVPKHVPPDAKNSNLEREVPKGDAKIISGCHAVNARNSYGSTE